MFKEFVVALVQKLITFLSTHPDFFAQSDSEKEKMCENISVPTVFKKYLMEVSEAQFLKDLGATITFTYQPKDKTIAKSHFFKAFLEFLNTDLARKIDLLDSNYALLQKPEREEVVENLIKGDSLLASSLKSILVNYTYQQICENINSLSQLISTSPYVVVQSPREITPEMKREIRKQINEKHPSSFPVFQINKKLIGGIRIFENGTTEDHSWLSRVLRFTSLTSA